VGLKKLVLILGLMVWGGYSQVTPCEDFACDSLVLRTILDVNGLESIPVDSVSLVSPGNGRIFSINLSNLGLVILPPEIGKFDSLYQLNLNDNHLSDLPTEITNIFFPYVFVSGAIFLLNNKICTINNSLESWLSIFAAADWRDYQECEFTANSLTIIQPNGGELLQAGSEKYITWTSTGDINNVKLEYSTDGNTWSPVFASTPNDGSQNTAVPNVVTTTAKVRVTNVEGTESDESDGNFEITTKPSLYTLTLITPNGGEILTAGDTVKVEYFLSLDTHTVHFEYSTGSEWTLINGGSSFTPFYWVVPSIESKTVKLRVTDDFITSLFDESDAVFEIITLLVNVNHQSMNKYSFSIKGSVLYSDRPIEAIRVYDLLGNMVWDGVGSEPGLSGGVYIVKLLSDGGSSQNRKILIGE